LSVLIPPKGNADDPSANIPAIKKDVFLYNPYAKRGKDADIANEQSNVCLFLITGDTMAFNIPLGGACCWRRGLL
jgi:hypothetical protein